MGQHRSACANASNTSAPTPWAAPGRRKHITDVAVVAVARELAGFLWGEIQA